MSLVPMRILLDHAAESGYGLAAFLVNNLEQIQAVMQAAAATDSPVILEASRGSRTYATDAYLRHLVQAAVEEHPGIPVAVHLHHGDSLESCLSAMQQGFTSVMVDTWNSPDYASKVRVTQQVVNAAHSRGVTVEGELDPLGGIEEGVEERDWWQGAESAQFVAETAVDALTVLPVPASPCDRRGQPNQEAALLERVTDLHRRLPDTHLTLHGVTPLLEALLADLRAYGGNVDLRSGVPTETLQACIRCGIRKISIDTGSRLAMTGAVRRVLTCRPEVFDPRVYLGAAREAMRKACSDCMELFGQAGKAGQIRATTCAEMVTFYATATAAVGGWRVARTGTDGQENDG